MAGVLSKQHEKYLSFNPSEVRFDGTPEHFEEVVWDAILQCASPFGKQMLMRCFSLIRKHLGFDDPRDIVLMKMNGSQTNLEKQLRFHQKEGPVITRDTQHFSVLDQSNLMEKEVARRCGVTSPGSAARHSWVIGTRPLGPVSVDSSSVAIGKCCRWHSGCPSGALPFS